MDNGNSSVEATSQTSTTTNGSTAPAPSTWDDFVALLENEWGKIKSWGEAEIAALVATAGVIVQTFSADAIAFVKQEAQAYLADISTGKMSLAQAATAVLNSAESQGVTLLEGVGTNALMGLIGSFIAAL